MAQVTCRQQSLPAIFSGEIYFFLETLRVFFAVFFTALFAFFAFFAFLAIVPSDIVRWLLDAACTRESRCTTSRIHQHTEKNSVPLKEVLTGGGACAQRTPTRERARRSQDDARVP